MSWAELIREQVDNLAVILEDNDMLSLITHAARSSYDGYGKAAYGTAVSRNALIVRKHVKRTSVMGNEIVSRTQVVILDQVSVAITDRITLPDGTYPPILDVESPLDGDGNPYMTVVYL